MKAFGQASIKIMLVHLLSFGQVSTLREYEAEFEKVAKRCHTNPCLRPYL